MIDYARRMGRVGGSRNTPAQQAARLANIARARKPRSPATRPAIIRARVLEECRRLQLPVCAVKVDGEGVWIDWQGDSPPGDLQPLHSHLVSLAAYPASYTLSLIRPERYS